MKTISFFFFFGVLSSYVSAQNFIQPGKTLLEIKMSRDSVYEPMLNSEPDEENSLFDEGSEYNQYLAQRRVLAHMLGVVLCEGRVSG